MSVATAQNLKSYGFNNVNQIAKQGAEEVTEFLYSMKSTVRVENVENDPEYQEKDIDLIWHYRSKISGKIEKKTIEIKADRYYRTGNYFFETVSNTNKNTPGCFLLTEADVIFYYFIDEKELHMLPTNPTRDWFLQNQYRFKEAQTSTSSKKGILYTSKGRKVPRNVVKNNVLIRVVNISSYISNK